MFVVLNVPSDSSIFQSGQVLRGTILPKLSLSHNLLIMGIEVRITCECKGNMFKFPFVKVKHFFVVASYLLFQKVFLQPGEQPRKPKKGSLMQIKLAVVSVMA